MNKKDRKDLIKEAKRPLRSQDERLLSLEIAFSMGVTAQMKKEIERLEKAIQKT